MLKNWLNKRRQKRETERILEYIRWRYRQAKRHSDDIYAEAMVLQESSALLNAWSLALESSLDHRKSQVRQIKDVLMRELFQELYDCYRTVNEQTGILLGSVYKAQNYDLFERARIRINYAAFRGDVDVSEEPMEIRDVPESREARARWEKACDDEYDDSIKKLRLLFDMNHGPYYERKMAKKMLETVNEIAKDFTTGQMNFMMDANFGRVVLDAQDVSKTLGAYSIHEYVVNETHKHVLYLAMKQAEIILFQNPEALERVEAFGNRKLAENNRKLAEVNDAEIQNPELKRKLAEVRKGALSEDAIQRARAEARKRVLAEVRRRLSQEPGAGQETGRGH